MEKCDLLTFQSIVKKALQPLLYICKGQKQEAKKVSFS